MKICYKKITVKFRNYCAFIFHEGQKCEIDYFMYLDLRKIFILINLLNIRLGVLTDEIFIHWHYSYKVKKNLAKISKFPVTNQKLKISKNLQFVTYITDN